MSSEMRKVHVIVSGRVQGVGFRAWMRANARQLGLDGWVRNRSDRSVEAVLSGDKARVDELLAMCKIGPLASRVLSVEVSDWRGAVAEGFIQQETAEVSGRQLADA